MGVVRARLARPARVVVGALVLLAAQLLVGAPSQADVARAATAVEAPAPVTAVLTPATLEVAPGADRVTVLTLTNPGDEAVTGVQLAWVGDDGITARGVVAVPTELAAGASVAIPVTVSRSADAPAAASVQAVVTYVAGPAATAAPRTAVGTLGVTAAATTTAATAPITVTAFVGTADLIQYQSTDVFFTIANTSGVAQDVSSVVVSYPSFLTLAYQPPQGAAVLDDDGAAGEGTGKGDGELSIPDDVGTLGPGDSTVVHLRLTAEGPLQPGSALVLLTVHAADARAGTEVTVVQSQSMTFAVLGESGVLTVLGVPSLLFVPGLIFAVVLWALWSYVLPGRGSATQLALTGDASVVVWAFALPATLAFPFLYPWVTDLFGPRRDYKTSYGLDDILYVWMMAAGAAVLVWGAYVVVRVLFVPQAGQSELRVLSTFALRPVWGRSLERPSAVRGTQLLVVLRRAGEKALVSPQVHYTPGDPPVPGTARLATQIKEHPLRAWWTLRTHAGALEVAYNTADGENPLTRPTWVDGTELTNPGTRYLVEERVVMET